MDLLHDDQVTILGETDFRGRHRPFGIKRDDRRYHLALIGKTGMGKSTLLQNLILADVRAGNGLALVDPHGDLAQDVAGVLESQNPGNLIYFNPTEPSGRLGLNVLEQTGVESHLVVSGVVSVFKKIWTAYWGPRMEHILRHALWALVEAKGYTLVDVPRLLTDRQFRSRVYEQISDPDLRNFWFREFEGYAPGFRSEAVSPILNKIGQFLSIEPVRRVVSHKESAFDVRQIMDQGRILIANLSKGKLGEDGSALLGALLVTKFELSALSRADLAPLERRYFSLYVDEFPSVATESFVALLSESRKYGLGLTLAMQYLDQLDEKLRNALLENVGTLIVFRVGPESARYLASHFSPVFSREDLMNLGRYELCLRLLTDGKPSKPFSARTLPSI
jgi:hypothetical protein